MEAKDARAEDADEQLHELVAELERVRRAELQRNTQTSSSFLAAKLVVNEEPRCTRTSDYLRL